MERPMDYIFILNESLGCDTKALALVAHGNKNFIEKNDVENGSPVFTAYTIMAKFL